jgi:hypothetical protein
MYYTKFVGGAWQAPQLYYDVAVNPPVDPGLTGVTEIDFISAYPNNSSTSGFSSVVAILSTVSALSAFSQDYLFSLSETPSAVAAASQLAFYGVRRIKSRPSGQRVYPFYEKPYQIALSFEITAAYSAAQPIFSVYQRVQSQITDFDFELRRITKHCTDGNGVVLSIPSPFAVVLYDSVMVARSNYPVLAEFLMDDTSQHVGRNYWPSPPILYRVYSNFTIDVYPLINSSVVLPVTVDLLLTGVRRIPC